MGMLKKIGAVLRCKSIGILVGMGGCVSHGGNLGSVNGTADK